MQVFCKYFFIISMDIAERLQLVIKNRCTTPYDISIQTGVDESILSRILNGLTKKPQKSTITKLAKHLHISEVWLQTGLGDMRAGQENKDIDADIANAVQELAAEGKQIGGSVPYEFVQALFEERKKHDEFVSEQQQIIKQLAALVSEFKKTSSAPEGNVGCAAVSGSDIKK